MAVTGTYERGFPITATRDGNCTHETFYEIQVFDEINHLKSRYGGSIPEILEALDEGLLPG